MYETIEHMIIPDNDNDSVLRVAVNAKIMWSGTRIRQRLGLLNNTDKDGETFLLKISTNDIM